MDSWKRESSFGGYVNSSCWYGRKMTGCRLTERVLRNKDLIVVAGEPVVNAFSYEAKIKMILLHWTWFFSCLHQSNWVSLHWTQKCCFSIKLVWDQNQAHWFQIWANLYIFNFLTKHIISLPYLVFFFYLPCLFLPFALNKHYPHRNLCGRLPTKIK